MLSFGQPLFLLLLLGLPPLVWWWQRRQRPALRYPGVERLLVLPRGRSRWAHGGGVALAALGLGSLIVALAGPRWPDQSTRLPTEGIAIMMLLDTSGSMSEPDFDWEGLPISRLEAVKKVFRLFVSGGEAAAGTRLEGRATDLVGLTALTNRPEVVCPLTLSHAALLQLLEAQQPQAEDTNIGDGIVWGLHRLRSATPRRKVLILLTDGYHNTTNPQAMTPRQAAQLAAYVGVPIYAIDAGRESQRPGESAADRVRAVQALQEVAALTGGQYFQAGDVPGLLAACRAIDQLERSEIRSFRYRRYHQGYPWFGLASFVFLAAGFVLEKTWWRRLP